MVDEGQLERLHETYVWHVNAAVGQGRMDLVEQLADEYLEEALGLMTADESSACPRPDCAACRRPPPAAPPPAPRSRWRRWLGMRPTR